MASISSAAAASSSLCSSSLLPSRRIGPHHHQGQRASTTIVSASRNDNYYGRSGKIVDENLIVLRKRIHEMKMIERNHEPPSHWMDWEKNCYAGYDEFICELMGLLQTQMMDARPCLVLGVAAIVALSVATSAAVVWFHLVEMSRGILAGVHLN